MENSMSYLRRRTRGSRGQEGSCSQSTSETDEWSNDGINSLLPKSLARRETRIVNILRFTVLALLLIIAVVVSVGVFRYTVNEENEKFRAHFHDNAFQLMRSISDVMERNMGALGTMGASVTSHALNAGLTFPFVTLPDFELLASYYRVQGGTPFLMYCPIVTDEKRSEWEEYALFNRSQFYKSFEQGLALEANQDAEFGVKRRRLQEQAEEKPGPTVLDDGSMYHPRIWYNGALGGPRKDEPEDSGPYLPLWQESPIAEYSINLNTLNLNFANTRVFRPDLIESLRRDNKAILNSAAIPVPVMRPYLEGFLNHSQYREDIEEFVNDPSTFVAYPVFDSFDADREVAGVIATNVYWKVLFSDILPYSSGGVVVVVENSYNQVFSYRIDGPKAKYLGTVDAHEPAYAHMGMTKDLNEFLERRAGPRNRAYLAVPLNENGSYRLSVYPTKDFSDRYHSNEPVLFTIVLAIAFALASFIFALFSFVVERRNRILMQTAAENAHKAAAAERELNEFLSHEVRNPLAAAIAACSFVATAVKEPEPLKDLEALRDVRADIDVVDSSLNFINDFLRSLLDIHRATERKLKIELVPTDLLKDVLEPVSAILYKRVASFDVQIDCPENLTVMTDPLRLKQVVLNLVRNSAKFVVRGFIRMRADVVDTQVQLYIEDSGPGIPAERRKDLFVRYQAAFDNLSQGTGMGLCLSKTLMEALNGDLRLDESYDSGEDGCPGVRFVLELRTSPLDVDFMVPNTVSQELLPSDVRNPSQEVNSSHGRVRNEGEQKSCEIEECQIPQLPESLSVLFVDDDAVLRKLFMRGVRRVAPTWTIQEASNGEIALQLCESQHFDLIFLDQYMASVNVQLLGTDTCRALRTKGVKSRICGLSANDLGESFRKAGADCFVLKPIPCKTVDLKECLGQIVRDDTRSREVDSPQGVISNEEEQKSCEVEECRIPQLLPESLSVLFVDDDAVLRKLFMRGVKRVAPTWTIQDAANGEIALQLCESQHFDVIFLDQYMATVDVQLLGTDTCRALRAKGVKSRICGLSANDLGESFRNAGADYFVLKPIPCKPVDLKECLSQIVRKDTLLQNC